MEFKIRNLMKSPLVTTTKNATIDYVRELMERKHIQAVPIVKDINNLEIEGIITSSDLRGIGDGSAIVENYMSNDVYRVKVETDPEIAARIMLEEGIHHLLVEEDNQVVGMLSSLDFVRLVAEKNFQQMYFLL